MGSGIGSKAQRDPTKALDENPVGKSPVTLLVLYKGPCVINRASKAINIFLAAYLREGLKKEDATIEAAATEQARHGMAWALINSYESHEPGKYENSYKN